jgi:hypothetical protein
VRLLNIVAIGAIFAAFANAQISKTDLAVNKLRKTNPAVNWNTKSAVSGDVNCDGQCDRVVLGSEKNSVVVGIVSGAQSEKPQVFSFPISRDTQDGFCASPTQIELFPLDCSSDEGALPGCTSNKSCQSFTVMDTECDPFNFYWDASRKTFSWWRN